MPGVVNDGTNRTLRREILAFGTDSLCEELMKRSVPLKLNPDDPAFGRMFPAACTLKEMPNGDLLVEFAGMGYAWSNLTKRVGFSATAAVHYEQDFRLDGSTAYVYFRPRAATSRRFDTHMVEESALPSSLLASVLPGSTPQGFVTQIGDGLLVNQLGEGFTVIREADGDATFGIGTLEPGDEPLAAYERTNESRVLYANERVEIHANQRDYLGPIDVPENGMALYLTVMVEGAPQVDVQVYPRAAANTWLSQYVTQAQAGPPPAMPLLDDTVVASADGQPTRRLVRVPSGQYFIVLDNTATAGRTAPFVVGKDDRAALVHVAIEVGDAP